MALSLDDVLNGTPRFRTKTVDYGNGLVFELHSFTASAFESVADKLANKDVPASEDDWIGVAMRAIQGEDFHPTPEQLSAFRANLDKGVIESLALDWLRFNRGAKDLAEAAKKS